MSTASPTISGPAELSAPDVEPEASGTAMFSIVVAVYDVARYLPDFMASIEAQDFDLGSVDVVMVDDGSTDDSLEVLRAWARRRPDLVRVLTKSNGGQGSARNLGMTHARGRWVTFIDPDDTVKSDYLTRVAAAIALHPDLVMVATNRIIHVDETGVHSDSHPLRGLFTHRDQFKDLDKFPEFFHGSAPAAFFRLDAIREHGLRFDDRIQPNFEDGHFCQRYLLRAPVRFVAFLRSAEYYYRKRLDQSSTLQTGSIRASRFNEVPQHGYLELLEEGADLNQGHAPEWLQNMIIYELSYYISPEDAGFNAATACTGAVAERFVTILQAIREHLDDYVIRSFTTRRLRSEWRQVLLYGLVAEDWHSPYVVTHKYDDRAGQVLISFRFTGEEPPMTVYSRGEPIEPVATKIRDYRYFEHTLIRERLCWVSARGTLRVQLAGEFVELRTNWTDLVPTSIRPSPLRRRFGLDQAPTSKRPVAPDPDELRNAAIRAMAARGPVRKQFKGAWVLMDRIGDSGDSGERLFKYLRSRRRKINAWFVLDGSSPDFARLKKEGYRRVVAYGSLTWKLLMLNCRFLISSHIDVDIYRPREIMKLRAKPAWSFVFLQHGVIKDDISGWLNAKEIALFVTSTPDEHTSIVGDGSRYKFTEKEVQRTGLPRFDRLREIGAEIGENDQDLILVAPTWRNWLNSPLRPGAHRREIVPDFAETDYAECWLSYLKDPALAEACAEQNLRIGFLPHPNLQAILADLDLPGHVEALRYADQDVQRLFARAAVLVTDYSSVAFNAAYIDRPLVYFQFDRERVEAGGHLGRKGYFSYERDGFGPVARTSAEAVRATVESLAAGRRNRPVYAERTAAAFPDRDGRCCERVVAAIGKL